MPVWNNRRNSIWLDVLILCEWVKSDTIRSVKKWIFLDVQDYWFAVSSLNVDAIHKDRHRVCSFVLPPQKNIKKRPSCSSTGARCRNPTSLLSRPNSARCSSMNLWFWQFFFVRPFHKVVKFNRKKWQDLSSSEFLGCPPWSKTVRRKTALEHIGFDRAQRVVRRSVHLVIRMIAVQYLGIHK